MDTVYQSYRSISTIINGVPVNIFSKPGLPDRDRVSPAQHLIAELVQPPPRANLLYLGCGQGACTVALASSSPSRKIWLRDINLGALRATEKTLQANGEFNFQIVKEPCLPEKLHGLFDLVVMVLPKGRGLVRRWLVEAWQALRPTGQFILAGSNNMGIQSAVKDAGQVFSELTILGYKKGSRLVRFIKRETDSAMPAWAVEPGISPGSWATFPYQFDQTNLCLHSLPGIFSYDRVDAGTRLLLNSITVQPRDKVLDLGCGYGIIGITAALMGAAWVDLVDINLLAVSSTQKNLAVNQIHNASAFASDVLSDVASCDYSLIISNPPFHSGKQVDYLIAQAFIEESFRALLLGGRLVIVANRFIQYDKLIKTIFGNVTRLTENNKYYVLAAVKG